MRHPVTLDVSHEDTSWLKLLASPKAANMGVSAKHLVTTNLTHTRTYFPKRSDFGNIPRADFSTQSVVSTLGQFPDAASLRQDAFAALSSSRFAGVKASADVSQRHSNAA